MKLSVVLPCYNEEKVIRQTVESVFAWMQKSHIDGEVVVTEDGSKDGSRAILDTLQRQYSNLRIVAHEKNMGYASSLRDGCDAATSENIAFMDSDGQFDPADLSTLLSYVRENTIIAGIRMKRADHFGRIINSRLFNQFACIVLGIRVKDIDCGMKVFPSEVWKKVRPTYATGALFNAELFYNAKRNHISNVQVPIHHYPRLHGKATGAKISIIVKTFLELFMLFFDVKRTHTSARS